ncbi:hypothetical protein GF322_03475 [Candidatus Dependentiae bacterium]|nr:hypothetical protein [Candidatus Dependentiae bacterium]
MFKKQFNFIKLSFTSYNFGAGLFLSALIFFNTSFLFCVQENVDVKNDIDIIKNFDIEGTIAQAEEILKEYENNPPLTEEEIDKISNPAFYKQKEACDFLSREIAQVPLEIPLSGLAKTLNNNISHEEANKLKLKIDLKLCNGDLVKIPLWGMDLYAERWFKNVLRNLFVEKATTKIKNDYLSLIKLFEKIDEYECELDEIFVDNDRKKELEGLLKKEENELNNYIKKENSFDYKEIFKNILYKKIFLYIVFFEFSIFIKEYFLGPRDITEWRQLLLDKPYNLDCSFYPLKMHMDNGNIIFNFDPEFSLTLTGFLKLFFEPTGIWGLFCDSYYNRSLVAGTNYFARLVSKLVNPLKCYTNNEGQVKKKIFFKILDHPFFKIIKEFFILSKTIKNLNSLTYKDQWISYLKRNKNEFLELLYEYRGAKESRNIKTIEVIEKELSSFILKGHDLTFCFWLQNKNKAFSSTEFKANILLSLPIMFLVGKFILNHRNDENFQVIKDKVNSIFKYFKNWRENPEEVLLVGLLSFVICAYSGLGVLSLYYHGISNY